MSNQTRPAAQIKPRPCRSCKALVYDLAHVRTGGRAPIDAATYADGNVQIDLERGVYTIIPAKERAAAVPLHKNHFVTCPDRANYGREARRPDTVKVQPPAGPTVATHCPECGAVAPDMHYPGCAMTRSMKLGI